jgi:hypothetical protein
MQLLIAEGHCIYATYGSNGFHHCTIMSCFGTMSSQETFLGLTSLDEITASFRLALDAVADDDFVAAAVWKGMNSTCCGR